MQAHELAQVIEKTAVEEMNRGVFYGVLITGTAALAIVLWQAAQRPQPEVQQPKENPSGNWDFLY